MFQEHFGESVFSEVTHPNGKERRIADLPSHASFLKKIDKVWRGIVSKETVVHENLVYQLNWSCKLVTVKRFTKPLSDCLASLWRRAITRNGSFSESCLRWPIYMINSVVELNFSLIKTLPLACNTSVHVFSFNFFLWLCLRASSESGTNSMTSMSGERLQSSCFILVHHAT